MVQDCFVKGYDGAPSDGSAREGGDCYGRVTRGGSWDSRPWGVRSAARDLSTPDDRHGDLGVFGITGFRVARTLTP